MPRLRVRLKPRQQSYEIKIGGGFLQNLGAETRASLGPGARRAAVISNPRVFELYGKTVLQSLRSENLKTVNWLMPEGERHKSTRSLEQALRFLTGSRLERNDTVIALGGGVVGDLAGLAAALYLRGVALVQAPTTLLAQIDASIGGKTAVNLPEGKNLVGAFHQPSLVLIDTDTLRTLPQRELTAGWCEAVKQGVVGSRELFNQTRKFLHRCGADFTLRAKDGEPQTEICDTKLSELITAHCRFKASIVSRDEHEEIARTDRYSRRILNFGHTTAHALEKVTEYRRFRHGEAVGHGMIVAGEISKNLGMLATDELESLREAVGLCGPLPPADDLSVEEIIRVISSDKKSVSGAVKWVLLERVGRPQIVDGKEISHRLVRSSVRSGLKQFS
jgi:3-dehydroquinate synthase